MRILILPLYILVLFSFSFGLVGKPADAKKINTTTTTSNSSAQTERNEEKRPYKMPSFSYSTLEGKTFSDKNLKANQRSMILYFNPLCEVCQRETTELLNHISYFNDMQIVMISPAMKEDIDEFVSTHKINTFPQITVLHDANDQFYKQFGAKGYPTMYLYDQNKKLIEMYETEIAMDDVKAVLDEDMAFAKRKNK